MFVSIFTIPSKLGEIRVFQREVVGAGLKPAGTKVGRPGFLAEIVDSGRFQTGPYTFRGLGDSCAEHYWDVPVVRPNGDESDFRRNKRSLGTAKDATMIDSFQGLSTIIVCVLLIILGLKVALNIMFPYALIKMKESRPVSYFPLIEVIPMFFAIFIAWAAMLDGWFAPTRLFMASS